MGPPKMLECNVIGDVEYPVPLRAAFKLAVPGDIASGQHGEP